MTEARALEFWSGFLDAIRHKLSDHVWQTWFAPMQCRRLNHHTVVLAVRDHFSRDWVVDHYIDFLLKSLEEYAGAPVAVEWEIDAHLKSDPEAEPEPVQDTGTHTHEPSPLLRQLNPRYNFEAFVPGPSNQFALAACRAVAENPAQSYNPLFIFGGVGLGKTHLLTAIGQHLLRARPHARVLFTSSEQFVNEVVNAVRFSKLEEFHAKYRRTCDVILMDDVQLIAGKERTQAEFFHIFNTLYDSQRQIVMTSDKLPHEIPNIEERLQNRFQWGLIADVQPPEMETRIAIVQKKAESQKFSVPDDVAMFLAENIRSNVRELEGALVRLCAHASLTGRTVNVDYARVVLADLVHSPSQQLSVVSIQKKVADYFHVRVLDLKSSRRQRVLVRPRQVAMYLCRKHANASYPELGGQFGDKDHTTVMSACRRVESLLTSDASLRSQVRDIERQLDVFVPLA